MKLFVAISLYLSLSIITSAVAKAQCSGCQMFLVDYDSAGAYMGAQIIPGVSTTFIMGPGTRDGECVGAPPDCVGQPCTFAQGEVEISNISAGGRVTVTTPGGTNVHFDQGDKASIGVASQSNTGAEGLECGGSPVTLLTLSHPNGTVYNIALICTDCPGVPPYMPY